MSQNASIGSRSSSAPPNGGSRFTEGTKIKGDLQSPGSIELLGLVQGTVTANTVLIEPSGSVQGEVHAASVTIKGQFIGKIFGKDVKLHANAKISGEIHCETLSVDSGAQLNATCTVKRQA